MFKVRLICIGKAKGDWTAQAAERYRKLLGRSCELEIVEIPESAVSPDGSTEALKSAEAERQLKRINSRHRVVALDKSGVADTSEEFAERLGRWQSLAPGVDVLLGGAFGLGAAALERADETVALSALTLSHQVARIVALEQLYRGFSILSGSPYHK